MATEITYKYLEYPHPFLAFVSEIKESIRLEKYVSIAVYGEQGSGKSLFAFLLAKILDNTYNSKRIPLEEKDIFNFAFTHTHKAYVIDDVEAFFHARRSMGDLNTSLAILLDIMRETFNIFIFTTPRPTSIDVSIRRNVTYEIYCERYNDEYAFIDVYKPIKPIEEDLETLTKKHVSGFIFYFDAYLPLLSFIKECKERASKLKRFTMKRMSQRFAVSEARRCAQCGSLNSRWKSSTETFRCQRCGYEWRPDGAEFKRTEYVIVERDKNRAKRILQTRRKRKV